MSFEFKEDFTFERNFLESENGVAPFLLMPLSISSIFVQASTFDHATIWISCDNKTFIKPLSKVHVEPWEPRAGDIIENVYVLFIFYRKLTVFSFSGVVALY